MCPTTVMERSRPRLPPDGSPDDAVAMPTNFPSSLTAAPPLLPWPICPSNLITAPLKSNPATVPLVAVRVSPPIPGNPPRISVSPREGRLLDTSIGSPRGLSTLIRARSIFSLLKTTCPFVATDGPLSGWNDTLMLPIAPSTTWALVIT